MLHFIFLAIEYSLVLLEVILSVAFFYIAANELVYKLENVHLASVMRKGTFGHMQKV